MKMEPIQEQADAVAQPQRFTGTLRTDLELLRGETGLDGRPSWVIFDPTGGNYFRISGRHYEIIRLLSTNLSVTEFMEKLHAAGVNASEAEVNKVLAFLEQSNLLRPAYGATAARVGKQQQLKAGMFWQRVLSSYLFFRVPLWAPDRFLDATSAFVRRLFNRWTMMLIWALVICGFISVIVNYNRLADAFVNSISFAGLVRYGLAVVLIKVVHEFAHAYTAKAFGCRVRKMGIAVVFFFPRFYSDLTDAWRISNRWSRLMIDAAGIMSEIITGGLAALVWSFSRPGMTREVAYYIFAVSIINTVFINGNPFIRYDGYYILMDLLGVDNLQRRSSDLFRSIWQKHLFGLAPLHKEEITGFKRGFLPFYAVGACIYRIFLYTSIILLVYYQFGPQIGIVLLVLEVYLLIFKPLSMEVKNLWAQRSRIRISRSAPALAGIALLIALFAVPLPWSVSGPAEIKPLSGVMVYAAEGGFLDTLPVADNQRLRAGSVVFTQRNPLLDWGLEEAELAAELNALEIDQAQESHEAVSRLDVLKQTRRNVLANLGELQHKRELLCYTSPIDGVFTRYDWKLVTGKWLNRGDIIGEVFTPGRVKVVGFLNENDALRLEAGEEVEILLPDRLAAVHGKVTGVHTAGARLSASPLLNIFGGPIIGTTDENGLFIPNESCYQVEVEVSENDQAGLPVGRTGVITYRRSSSLGADMIRSFLSVLRREFNL